MEEKTKQEKCRFCNANLLGADKVEYLCCVNGMSDDKIKKVFENDCECCERYKSRYIEYPITVNGIDNDFGKPDDKFDTRNCGKFVSVRPCDEKCNGKTFLGIHLGELPISNLISYREETGKLKVSPMRNPAIFIPELNKIVYGCESWWCYIEKEEDFEKITDEKINSTWYVKLAKQMFDINVKTEKGE